MILTPESLAASLATHYPDRPSAETNHVADLARELTECGYGSVEQVEANLVAAHEAALTYERDHPPSSPDGRFNPVGIARMTLCIADRQYARFRGPDEYIGYRALLTGSPSEPGPQSSAPPSQSTASPMRPVPSRGVDADAFIEFLRTGVDRLYHGKWQDFSGGFGTAIEVDGLDTPRLLVVKRRRLWLGARRGVRCRAGGG